MLDVNDNAPVFQRRDYAVTVPEDVAVGTEVLRVMATSADIGPNAEITYHIRAGNELGKFTIDRNLGEQRSLYVLATFRPKCKNKIVKKTFLNVILYTLYYIYVFCFRLCFCG